jgi:hypothetical protein
MISSKCNNTLKKTGLLMKMRDKHQEGNVDGCEKESSEGIDGEEKIIEGKRMRTSISSTFSSINNLNGLYLGQFFPSFSDNEINSFLSIERLKKCHKSIILSGTISEYRNSYALTLSELVKPDFEVYINSFNSVVSSSKNSLFSLNISQSKSWQFFSPSRIYRAIIIDQNIPLIDFNFNQHPLEDLCFNIDLLQIKSNKNNFIYYSHSLEEIQSILAKKIYSYNSFADYQNSLLLFRLSESKTIKYEN